MRLSSEQVNVFITVLDPHLKGTGSKLYLYGSRVFDHKKGGDIDLLLVVPSHFMVLMQEEKLALLVEFKKHLGDRKIDLTLADDIKIKQDPFLKNILENAVLLNAWTHDG